MDKLNYAAPGAIRCAAEAGYSAEMSSTDTSATMTVTNVPKSGAEVWKLKLMVSTGLKPEPGKTYRFRATLNSSNSGSYEACYNEGEVEKGYDVLYNQSLKSGNQTVERMIYVPTDKENPGELIVQFSLGKLSKGTKVTISKVTVEEASPAYTSALAKDFALDYTKNYERKFFETGIAATSTTPEALPLAWNQNAFASIKGDYAEKLTFDGDGNPQIHVKGGSANVYDALFHLETDVKVEAGKQYQVCFELTATNPYFDFDVYFGNGYNDRWANNKKYGSVGGQNHPGGGATKQFRYTIAPGEDGSLIITPRLGKTSEDNIVTVSNLKVKEILRTVDFPNNCYLGGDKANTAALNVDKQGTITVTVGDINESSPSTGHTVLFIKTGFDKIAGKQFRVREPLNKTHILSKMCCFAFF